MHIYIQGAYNYFLARGWHYAYAAGLCFMLELLFPADRHSIWSRARGIFFNVTYFAINAAFFSAFLIFWGKIGIRPFFSVDFSPFTTGPIGPRRFLCWIGVLILVGTLFDFFYYWFHRMQHTFGFLWRFHAVHHSLREMNALNSYHHWTEEIFRIPVVTLPMSLLFSFNQGAIPIFIVSVIAIQGHYEHSATRLSLGWFRYIVADNRFHRIHHSIEERHYNKNFGSFSTIWDLIFRTAHFPQRGEWPETGIRGTQENSRLGDFLFARSVVPPSRHQESQSRRRWST